MLDNTLQLHFLAAWSDIAHDIHAKCIHDHALRQNPKGERASARHCQVLTVANFGVSGYHPKHDRAKTQAARNGATHGISTPE